MWEVDGNQHQLMTQLLLAFDDFMFLMCPFFLLLLFLLLCYDLL